MSFGVLEKNVRRSRVLPDNLRYRVLVPGLLRSGRQTLRRGGWRLLALYAVTQAVLLALLSPLIHWMFTEALAAAGLHAVSSTALASLFGNGGSIAWVAGLCFLAVLGLSVQLTLLVLAAARVHAGLSLSPAALVRAAVPALRRVAHPGSLPLVLYLFLVLPLAQAGFFSVLTHSIAVPNFISGELLKSAPGIISYVVFMVVLGTLGLRFSLALPIFALTGISGGRAMRLSWRLTRRTDTALMTAGAAAAAAAFLAGAVLVAAALLPTLAADLLVPRAAAVTAAFSLGAAQVAGVVIAGSFVMCLAAMLIELTVRRAGLLPADAVLSCGDEPGGRLESRTETAVEPRRVLRRSRPASRRGRTVTAAAAVVPALILGALNIQVMGDLQEVPQTLVLGHRGFSEGGVENTISGLAAAADAGADLVEMDVLQTLDGEFVVMHDASLARLAGRKEAVKDLTLAELTAITVHDQHGHADTIPSLEEYILAAQALGEPLLIEMKLHGGETEDYVQRLVAQLESLDALQENIYHSLDQEKAEQLKQLRPGLYVGLTMAVAGLAAPDTTADFIVVEEASYTDAVRESAWANGKEFYLWTVNGGEAVRNALRDNVDGIITDHPDTAVAARGGMGADEPMSSKLYDAIMRFVVIF